MFTSPCGTIYGQLEPLLTNGSWHTKLGWVEMDSNQRAWENWAQDRPGTNNSTAVLTDTLTTELFFKTVKPETILDMMAYRQDSGEPMKFVQDLILFHRQHNALELLKDKTVIFSDGLDVKKIEAIDSVLQTMRHPFEYKFGIGTNLTNDVGVVPLKHGH
jgi:nicotinate phosphoribosyltransferase